MKDRIIDKIRWFIKSDFLIYFSFLFGYLGWLLRIEPLILTVFIALAIFCVLYEDDIAPLIPLIINPCFMCRSVITMNNIPIFHLIYVGLLFGCLIFYLIKHKINIWHHNGLKWPLLAFVISSIISSFFTPLSLNFFQWLLNLSGVIYLFLYLFFACSIKEDKVLYLAKTIFAAGIVLSFQVMSVFLENIFASISKGEDIVWTSPNLGWGVSNDAAMFINFGIGFGFYLSYKLKRCEIPLVLIGIMISTVILTQSRGSIYTLIIGLPLYIYFLFKLSEKKKTVLIALGIGIFTSLFLLIIFWDGTLSTIERLAGSGISDNGRFKLYDLAISCFKNSPIFGRSIYCAVDVRNRLIVFHSSIFQTLGCYGIVGILVFIFYWFSLIRMFWKKRSPFIIFTSIALLVINIHGLFDNVFYMFIYMIISHIVIAVCENEKQDMIEEIS